MGVKEKIIDVIKDPALANISFSLDGVRVVGIEFQKLIGEIANGTLQVGVDPSIGTPAEYDPTRNVIRLKSDSVGSDVGSKAAIAHECTHAYLSNHNLPRITGEVAGYLVEVLFALAKDEKLTRDSASPEFFGRPATCGARSIGEQALDLIDRKGMNRRSCLLTGRDYAGLANAIRSVPQYSAI